MFTFIKKHLSLLLVALLCFVYTACSAPFQATQTDENTVLLAAASSLEGVLSDEVLPAFEAQYPHINVVATYAASGFLRQQIEAGLGADIFLSADTAQVDALQSAGLVHEQVPLLQNELVAIVPAKSETTTLALGDIPHVGMIAMGDPASVPAGRYAKESLQAAGLWPLAQDTLSLATDVTQVLSWVSQSSADLGFVYASDAARMPQDVRIVPLSPPLQSGSIVYPAALLQNTESTHLFYEFLQTDATPFFETAGFSVAVPSSE